jgi:hypothetical protein
MDGPGEEKLCKGTSERLREKLPVDAETHLTVRTRPTFWSDDSGEFLPGHPLAQSSPYDHQPL